MTDETTSEQLVEIDRDMADIERQVAELVEEAQQVDYPQPEPETTTEQLAEIEGQGADTPATEYTPPEGWRVLRSGEVLQDGDKVVNLSNGKSRPTLRAGRFVENNQCYIRLIKSEPQAAAFEELRSEVSYVQRLLGESRQRVTQLEELVASLRTINEAQEKAFAAAGKENTALRNQLAAVKAELANVAADRQQLRVELDAAQQVPADSPELRQLRLDLAEVTQDRDTYRHAHELLLNDVNATHQRTKVMTIEAIVEWLVPIRTCGSQALATAVISNLPHIMRHLTGLEDEGIE